MPEGPQSAVSKGSRAVQARVADGSDCLVQENRQPRPLSKSVFGTLDTVSAAQPTAVLRRKRAHTGFSFDHPGFESHFADEVNARDAVQPAASWTLQRELFLSRAFVDVTLAVQAKKEEARAARRSSGRVVELQDGSTTVSMPGEGHHVLLKRFSASSADPGGFHAKAQQAFFHPDNL